MGIRVRIKPELCQGHAMCRLACPELFHLNDDDGHAYLTSEDVPVKFERNVKQAVQSCPEQAIEIY
jgi:ferredoxin